MTRFVLPAVLLLAFTANTFAQSNNPAPPPPQTDKAGPALDPGQRKLSRHERKERMKNLPEKYRQFLEEVDPIILPTEIDTFLLLETDAQRDAWITEFWRRRDQAQGTTHHAFHDVYMERLEHAREAFKYLASDRSRVYLIQGEPSEIIDIRCERYLVPIQIWKYFYVPGFGHDVRFIFYQQRYSSDWKLWQPMSVGTEDMGDLIAPDSIGVAGPAASAGKLFAPSAGLMSQIEVGCVNSDELMKAIYQVIQNKTDLHKVFEPPQQINEEDVHKTLRSVVISNPNAPKLAADWSVQFPAKSGSRTDAQMTLMIPRAQLTMKEVSGTKLYSIDVTGEVLKDDKMYESYRYRFDYPGDSKDDKLAAVVDRFLRPSDYQSRIRVTDINSGAEAIIEKPLAVPELFDTPEQQKQKEAAATAVNQLRDAVESNETRIRLVPLTDDLIAGVQHIDTIAYGNNIKAVEFYLDGHKVMVKRMPPYQLDLDFGSVPRLHRIRAIALDAAGKQITGDELMVNTGNEPFRVRIVAPRVALNLRGATRVEMSVNVPEGKKLDALELYLNETRVATLYGPPYVQTVTIPQTEGVGYLRAVAKVKDETIAPVEDVVMINTPQFMEEVNVHLVELPTTVIARSGHPITTLSESAFRVFDEGKPVKVSKFEYVKDLPLNIGMAIDTSASMQPRMAEAQRAGSQFLTNVMRKGDRGFLVSFDTQPQLIQKWSSALADLNAGLAKLRAEESTALYDAIVYSLYNFVGVKGQKALVVITDGQDTSSKFSFEQALEYARRAAVPIYGIGIGIRNTEVDVRYKFGKFCQETGGNVYYIDSASDLNRIYVDIRNELRSQYVLGFYPAEGVKPGSKWHEVSVQVSEGKAKTIRGYYP